jgi:hypothetical protein
MGEACIAWAWRALFRGLVEKLRERDHVENPGVNGKVILMWVIRNWGVGYGLDRAGTG